MSKMATIWQLQEQFPDPFDFVDALPADWSPEQILAALSLAFPDSSLRSNLGDQDE